MLVLKLKRNIAKVLILALSVSLLFAYPLYADDDTSSSSDDTSTEEDIPEGKWEKTEEGYMWNDGTGYPLSVGWHWIDTDKDGIEECYYINIDGCRLENCVTPDGKKVDSNGKWVSHGIVQLKFTPSPGFKYEDVKGKLSSESQAHKNNPDSIEIIKYEEKAGEFDKIEQKILDLGYDPSDIADMTTVEELLNYLAKKEKEESEKRASEKAALEAKKEKIFDKEWLKKYEEHKKKKMIENGEIEETEETTVEETTTTAAPITKSATIIQKAKQ